MVRVWMQQVAVKFITLPTLAASGSRGLHGWPEKMARGKANNDISNKIIPGSGI